VVVGGQLAILRTSNASAANNWLDAADGSTRAIVSARNRFRAHWLVKWSAMSASVRSAIGGGTT
jgi:hypothetical protein